jgi:hypothetical protein
MRSLVVVALVSAALTLGVAEAGAAPPPNDDFGNATVVGTLPLSQNVNLRDARGAVDDPQDCSETHGNTAWYSYTPAEATRIRATLTGTDSSFLSVSLYTGTRGALQLVACETGNRFASFKLDLPAGTTYYLMLDSAVDVPAIPLRSFILERIAPATNDEVASATTVDPLPFDQIVDGRLLTRAPSDPSCGAGWTAWYVFTAPSPMRVEVDTVTPSEARIGVYAGAPSDGSQVLCSGAAFHPTRRVEVAAGTHYVLVVGDTVGANRGDLTLRLREVPVLATNDDFDQAKVVGALPFRDWIDTRQATVAPDDPAPCPFSSRGSVWYAFTAPHDMRIVADASGTTDYNSISVYTGVRGGLTRIACGSSGDEEPGPTGSVGARVSFMGTAGTTYYFMVTLQGSEGGDVVFAMPLANSLTLVPSKRPIRYGSSLRLRGHLEAFAETANDQVTIYATPHGQAKRAIGTVPRDAAGNFALTVRPRVRTIYVAEWTGDGPYPALTSPQQIVAVRAIANLRLLGWFGRSGATKLYRRGTNPSLIAWVNPAHVGSRIVLQLQARRPGGPWSSPATASFRIGATGRVRVVITGLPTNLTYRVRSQFRADADHLGSFSPWNAFRFA